MKLCVAQTRPVAGDVTANLARHVQLIHRAGDQGTDLIIFSELSLTGYEPSRAASLATTAEDERFEVLQETSNKYRIVIGAGMPTRGPEGVCISLILFQPHRSREIHHKEFLHPDEYPFFVGGNSKARLTLNGKGIALGICYEISVPEHVARITGNAHAYYVASVAKTGPAMEASARSLAGIAKSRSVTVLMSNSIGPCEEGWCAGESAIWNDQGLQVARLNRHDEGLLIFDDATHHTASYYL